MDDSEKDRPHVYSSLAQLAEHAAVNRRVVGSNPTGGARIKQLSKRTAAFLFVQNPAVQTAAAAVNWLRVVRCLRQKKDSSEQEETQSDGSECEHRDNVSDRMRRSF